VDRSPVGLRARRRPRGLGEGALGGVLVEIVVGDDDLRGLSDATDWFLITSGDSDTHSRAIADNIVERMRESGFRAAGVEGKAGATWILLDYITLVIHVFLPRVRDYYELERLWGDAPALAVE